MEARRALDALDAFPPFSTSGGCSRSIATAERSRRLRAQRRESGRLQRERGRRGLIDAVPAD